MKIIDTFKSAIKEGMESAALIEKASDRAQAYASIANAIAVSGVLKRDALLEEELPKGKESLKPETSKKRSTNKKKPVEQPEILEEEVVIQETEIETEEIVIEEQDEAEIEEVEQEETQEESEEIVSEWTDETLEQFAEEKAFVDALLEDYDEQSVSDQLSWWSEGAYTTVEDISPLNIAGFVAFLKSEFGQE